MTLLVRVLLEKKNEVHVSFLSLAGSLTGDSLFADASSRTVNSDPMPAMYRMPPAAPPPNTYGYLPNVIH